MAKAMPPAGRRARQHRVGSSGITTATAIELAGQMKPLAAGRLTLKPIEDEVELYANCYTSPEVMRHIGPPLQRGVAIRLFHEIVRGNRDPAGRCRMWVVTAGAEPEPLGLAAITRHTEFVEMGVMLLPGAQGQGHAADAFSALAGWAVQSGVRVPLLVRHDPGNLAMQRVAQRLGYQRMPATAAPGGVVAWRVPAVRDGGAG